MSVVTAGKEGTHVYIIDPAFREQFDIAHATPRYQQILAAIPSTFVGTEERLVALVRALCQEIQGVFLEQNATLPPWRDVAAQLSKWRPRHSMDRPVSPLGREDAAVPSHNLDLVSTLSANLSEPEKKVAARAAKAGGLGRTSAPIALAPTGRGGSKGEQGGKAGSGPLSSRPNLYQCVAAAAGPVQQLVSRSYTQSGLLVMGL